MAGTCGRRQRPRLGRRGRLPAGRQQGAAPRPGLSPARVAAHAGAVPVQCGTARPLGAARGQQRLRRLDSGTHDVVVGDYDA
ncbi:hypothetical protein BHM03_00059266 [Ensete ventricosum]|nr:hypothetical protein BHM03_00059266 [Ensete ventricosum]